MRQAGSNRRKADDERTKERLRTGERLATNGRQCPWAQLNGDAACVNRRGTELLKRALIKFNFEMLIGEIHRRTGSLLSLSTVKRFWGYVDKGREGYRARQTTLDILSQFVGFHDRAAFCQATVEGGRRKRSDGQPPARTRPRA